ncbi:MAG: Rrf2 family transcriptional regulator [Phycisphaeraceae bacterium]|nr:Rrf2 family transcriptional regulator [Phycisphaeraceae bacterium]
MFPQTTEYALRSMACLALYRDDLVPATTLAEMTKVPANYLAKVLQQLADSGLVSGRRGVGGGYKLARSPEDIALIDILRAVGKLDRIERCPLGLPNHGTNLCPLHRTMDKAIGDLIETMSCVSLHDLVNDPKGANKPLCDAATTVRLTMTGMGSGRKSKL